MRNSNARYVAVRISLARGKERQVIGERKKRLDNDRARMEEERWAARLYETASRREWRRDRLYAPFHLLFLAPGTLKLYTPEYFKGPDLPLPCPPILPMWINDWIARSFYRILIRG